MEVECKEIYFLPNFPLYFDLLPLGGVCCALAGMLEFFQPGPYFVAIAVLIRELVIFCEFFQIKLNGKSNSDVYLIYLNPSGRLIKS